MFALAAAVCASKAALYLLTRSIKFVSFLPLLLAIIIAAISESFDKSVAVALSTFALRKILYALV
jgi:hypothetical protein